MGYETVTKTKKIGGSIFVGIPKEIIEVEKLNENQMVSIEIDKIKKSWFGAFKGIGPFTHEDEMKSHD